MAESNKKVNLIREHEAIRAQISSLIGSLVDSTGHGFFTDIKPHLLKNQLQGYIWALQNLRDALRHHIEMDEHIIQNFRLSDTAEALLKEHKEILREIDHTIQFASEAIENELNKTVIIKYRSDLTEAVGRISNLVNTHITNEDALLKYNLKDTAQ